MAFARKHKNFNFVVDGISQVGQVTEVVLPKITRKMEDFQAGGMDAPVKVDMSGEALSMEHTYGGIMYDIIGQMFLPSASGLNMRFSGAYVRDDTGGTDKVEVVVRGRHSEVDPGKAKVGDDTEFKVTSELTYYKLTVNNKVLMEIDILNFVYKVNGVDRLADQRKAMNL